MEYKGKALYSRYAPVRSPLNAANNLPLDGSTLVLAFSPLLGYGVEKLLERGAFVVAVELEEELFALTRESLSRFLNSTGKFVLLRNADINGFLERLGDGEFGKWKNVTSIHLSAAFLLHEAEYCAIENAVREAVSVFWRNILTLTHFARLYSKNFFLNLALSAHSSPFPRIKKPILIAASGEGLEKILSFFVAHREAQSSFFIISVDASLCAFREAGITADAVISEDAQSTVRRFFAGFAREKVKYAFCSLSSAFASASLVAEKTCFYITRFAKSSFIFSSPLAETSPVLLPLGSVALQAVCLANMIREDKNVPILVGGADFSFSVGKTHARGTYFDLARRALSTRFFPTWNFSAAFSPSAFSVGSGVYSTMQLSYYARLFAARFHGIENAFLVSTSPFELSLPYARLEDFLSFPCAECEEGEKLAFSALSIFSYIKEKDDEILRLKELILNGAGSEAELLFLMRRNEYLFLNFPDGSEPSIARHFLRRVAVQIDYFRKFFDTALDLCDV